MLPVASVALCPILLSRFPFRTPADPGRGLHFRVCLFKRKQSRSVTTPVPAPLAQPSFSHLEPHLHPHPLHPLLSISFYFDAVAVPPPLVATVHAGDQSSGQLIILFAPFCTHLFSPNAP